MLKFLLFMIMPIMVYAQDPSPMPLPGDPTVDFLKELLASIGGLKGASALTIAAVAIKLLLQLLNLPFVASLLGSKFKEWNGGVKLVVVLGLSYVGGVLALMLPPTSLSVGAALVHSTTLASFMVFTNQIYQHWFMKKQA